MGRIECTRGFAFYVPVLFVLIPGPILAAFLLASVVHEAAHLAALRACRCRIDKLVLGAADVQIVHGFLSSEQEVLCAAAGPMVNLLCGFLFLREASSFALASLLLGGFNLLPVMPLDGGRMLRAALQIFLPCDTAERIAERTGIICCAAVLALAVIAVRRFQMGLWPLMPAIMLPLRLHLMEKAVAFPSDRG